MDETKVVGSAGSALAAHSKDASMPGKAPAAEKVGGNAEPAGMIASANALFGQAQDMAQDMAKRVSSSLSDTGRWARETMSGQGGQVASQTMDLVRARPLTALAVSGAVGLVLGMLIARR